MPLTLSGNTGIAGVDGSASVPSVQGSDTNTGIFYPAADTVGVSTGGSERMRVDSSGNVGIGTSSPSTYGNLVVNFSGSSKIVARESTTGNQAILYADGGAAFSGAVSNIPYLFLTNNTERARIDTSGNLLVGTTGLVAKLNVVASSLVSAGYNTYFRNTWSGDVGYPALYVAKYDNNTTTSQIFMRFSVNNESTASGQINANGANSAAFGSFSDERLKENIVNLPSQLENICSLRPVEFDYKDGSGHQIGFVAQEMQEIYPDVVGVGADDMLTITGWSKTEARLVKAIQELSAKVDAQAAEIAALKANAPA